MSIGTVYLEVDETLGEQEILWRYMDLPKLVSLFEREALWLARADTFRDRQEGRFPAEMRSYIESAYKDFPELDPSPIKNADDFQDYLVRNAYISCWHKNLDENMVMWEIYGRDQKSIAVKTSVERLKEHSFSDSLPGHSLLLKPVNYKDPSEVQGILPYEECFFLKRPHFAFEREVRICLDTYSRAAPTKGTARGYQLPVFLNGLIKAIVVHPDSESWFVDVVTALTTRYDIHSPVELGIYGNK